MLPMRNSKKKRHSFVCCLLPLFLYSLSPLHSVPFLDCCLSYDVKLIARTFALQIVLTLTARLGPEFKEAHSFISKSLDYKLFLTGPNAKCTLPSFTFCLNSIMSTTFLILFFLTQMLQKRVRDTWNLLILHPLQIRLLSSKPISIQETALGTLSFGLVCLWSALAIYCSPVCTRSLKVAVCEWLLLLSVFLLSLW